MVRTKRFGDGVVRRSRQSVVPGYYGQVSNTKQSVLPRPRDRDEDSGLPRVPPGSVS